jgi:hypothetical protein
VKHKFEYSNAVLQAAKINIIFTSCFLRLGYEIQISKGT